jgi:hypothetical protein
MIVVYHLVPVWDDHGKGEGFVIEAQEQGSQVLLDVTPDLAAAVQEDRAAQAAKQLLKPKLTCGSVSQTEIRNEH